MGTGCSLGQDSEFLKCVAVQQCGGSPHKTTVEASVVPCTFYYVTMHVLACTASQAEGTTTEERRKSFSCLWNKALSCMSLCTGSCTPVLWTHHHLPELTSPGLAEAGHSDKEDLGEHGPCRRGRG